MLDEGSSMGWREKREKERLPPLCFRKKDMRRKERIEKECVCVTTGSEQ